MNYQDAHKKILAAQTLLSSGAGTSSKLKSVSTLLQGIHPRTDAALARAEKEYDAFEKLYGGEIIELGVEQLPENTEEQKKRKKALLLLFNTWDTLRDEVARVDAELTAAHGSGDGGSQVSLWGKILNFAKGPLGIFTIVAVGAVLVMQKTSVEIAIKNEGCGTMVASGGMPFSIPGLSLPKDPIPNGGTGIAVLPPLTVTVDGTQSRVFTLKALKFSTTFNLPNNITDVTLNGSSLLGKKQDVRLGDQKQHTLAFVCR